MINATNSGNANREIIPAGNYIARCYSMIHVGTVEEDIMGELKVMNKCRITWELPGELRVFDQAKGEQPLVISKEYTLSMHEKANLRRDLESWRGKAFTEEQAKSFDIAKLLGAPCMLNIIHKTTRGGKDYAMISNISSLPKGFNCPPQINDTFEWNFEDKFDAAELEKMPDFIKDKVKSSAEYKTLMNDPIDLPHNAPPVDDEGTDSDMPF